MTDNEETVPAALSSVLDMQVDVIGSPTEVADTSDVDIVNSPVSEGGTFIKEEEKVKTKLEKRKRERKKQKDGMAPPVFNTVPDSEDEDLESPSKRSNGVPSGSGERPLRASDIKEILVGHVQEMKNAWTSFQGCQKDVLHQRQVAQEQAVNLDSLTTDVKNMKVRLDAMEKSGRNLAAPPVTAAGNPDPWGEFLRRRDLGHASEGAKAAGGASGSGDVPDKGDLLTEDEKKTLVLGGWLQDTRRSTIEEESAFLFELPEVKNIVDAEKLLVYGPRRSVGVLKFKIRDGETEKEMRERMWQVIRVLAQAKHILPSTRTAGDDRSLWASFVKTKNARLRSTHVSMIRRVTMSLAKDAHHASGGRQGNGLNLQTTAYDCDWNLGTIWCGALKLGSSTHRVPKEEETVVMTGGWVSITAVARTALCSTEEAKRAFEEIGGPPSGLCAKHRWGRVGQWNIAGQKLDLLDVAAKDLDILFVQEISRDKPGWEQLDRDEFHWVVHRKDEQWRGVGIGIAGDKFDSVIFKRATSRGIWVVPRWVQGDSSALEVSDSGANLNALLHESMLQGIKPVSPQAVFARAWTHFPRDERRSGRHIDMLLGRQMHVTAFEIDPDRRLAIGSDHALLFADIWVAGGPARVRWTKDSRARWVTQNLPDVIIVDDGDLTALAKTCTRPRTSSAFKDDAETHAAIRCAKETNDAREWKRVHRLRQAKRKKWRRDRLSAILSGDWDQYRMLQAEKKRVKGWWGDLLRDRSAAQLTSEIQDHLEEKMTDRARPGQWDAQLQDIIDSCDPVQDFEPFQLHEVWEELQHMKCRSAVGPDLIGVHLLRAIASHETLGEQFVELINHIVRTQELPASWEESFLALLAKVPLPQRPADLRPICVSSAFNKCVNRLVCSRVLPVLRGGSKISCCGRGRQAADLVGCVTRIRDVCHEWKMPLLLCKLDVAGAFDRVRRGEVAGFLRDKLCTSGMNAELRYMLSQLRTHSLRGTAPGGIDFVVRPDVGIKQGAPESAEIFGLLVDSLMSSLTMCRQWLAMGKPFDDVDIDLLFYQDDIFLVETSLTRLCRKIKAIDKCLKTAGLSLATEKTKIVANEHYVGARRAEIAGDMFVVSEAGEALKVLGLNFSLSRCQAEQSQELIARTREAVSAHRDILQAHGAWVHKVHVMKSLVEAQFNWIAGAVYWSREEPHSLNLLQLHTLRSAFHLHRLDAESWVDWNARSLRFVRVWMVNNSVTEYLVKLLPCPSTCHCLPLDFGFLLQFSWTPMAPTPPWLLFLLLGALAMDDGKNFKYWEKWSDEEIAARKAEELGVTFLLRLLGCCWHRGDAAADLVDTRFKLDLVVAHLYLYYDEELFEFQQGDLLAPIPEVTTQRTRKWTGGIFYVIVVAFADVLDSLPHLVNLADQAAAGSTSSSSSCRLVSFYDSNLLSTAGEWQARARTPSEERSHRGGEWKPSWLVKYIDEKHQRFAETTACPTSGDGETDPDKHPPTADATEQPLGEWVVRCFYLVGNVVLDEFLVVFGLLDIDFYLDLAAELDVVIMPAAHHYGCHEMGGRAGALAIWGALPVGPLAVGGDFCLTPACLGWLGLATTTSTSMSAPEGDFDFPPNHGLFPEVRPIGSDDEASPWVLQLTGSERRHLQEAGLPTRALQRVEDLLQSLEDHQSADHGPEARWALGRLAQRVDEALDSMQSALNILARQLQPRGVWPVVRAPRAQVDQLRLFNWMRRYEDIFSQTFEHHLATPLQPTEFPGSGQYGQLVAQQQQPERARSRSPPRAAPAANPTSPESAEEELETAADEVLEEHPDSAVEVLPPLHVAVGVAAMPGMQEVLQGQLQGIWVEDEVTLMETSATTSTSTTTSSTLLWTSLFIGTTSTTSTTSVTPTPDEIVRNATARELVYANTADVIDMAHRLLARSRVLLRNQRLLCEAVEEALLWFPTPPQAPALNSPTMDARLWGVIACAAATGDPKLKAAYLTSLAARLLVYVDVFGNTMSTNPRKFLYPQLLRLFCAPHAVETATYDAVIVFLDLHLNLFVFKLVALTWRTVRP
ncbi:pol [Symbiodinium necroappetens]|uniref:Pol protein n=1 Tax=Symbiodinium necroappetens TaxID=1628268 RepID=A0A813BMX3_9DINO|nr:pol [Symbiodinium necroappetens]